MFATELDPRPFLIWKMWVQNNSLDHFIMTGWKSPVAKILQNPVSFLSHTHTHTPLDWTVNWAVALPVVIRGQCGFLCA